jgi:hypothetical protein
MLDESLRIEKRRRIEVEEALNLERRRRQDAESQLSASSDKRKSSLLSRQLKLVEMKLQQRVEECDRKDAELESLSLSNASLIQKYTEARALIRKLKAEVVTLRTAFHDLYEASREAEDEDEDENEDADSKMQEDAEKKEDPYYVDNSRSSRAAAAATSSVLRALSSSSSSQPVSLTPSAICSRPNKHCSLSTPLRRILLCLGGTDLTNSLGPKVLAIIFPALDPTFDLNKIPARSTFMIAGVAAYRLSLLFAGLHMCFCNSLQVNFDGTRRKQLDYLVIVVSNLFGSYSSSSALSSSSSIICLSESASLNSASSSSVASSSASSSSQSSSSAVSSSPSFLSLCGRSMIAGLDRLCDCDAAAQSKAVVDRFDLLVHIINNFLDRASRYPDIVQALASIGIKKPARPFTLDEKLACLKVVVLDHAETNVATIKLLNGLKQQACLRLSIPFDPILFRGCFSHKVHNLSLNGLSDSQLNAFFRTEILPRDFNHNWKENPFLVDYILNNLYNLINQGYVFSLGLEFVSWMKEKSKSFQCLAPHKSGNFDMLANNARLLLFIWNDLIDFVRQFYNTRSNMLITKSLYYLETPGCKFICIAMAVRDLHIYSPFFSFSSSGLFHQAEMRAIWKEIEAILRKVKVNGALLFRQRPLFASLDLCSFILKYQESHQSGPSFQKMQYLPSDPHDRTTIALICSRMAESDLRYSDSAQMFRSLDQEPQSQHEQQIDSQAGCNNIICESSLSIVGNDVSRHAGASIAHVAGRCLWKKNGTYGIFLALPRVLQDFAINSCWEGAEAFGAALKKKDDEQLQMHALKIKQALQQEERKTAKKVQIIVKDAAEFASSPIDFVDRLLALTSLSSREELLRLHTRLVRESGMFARTEIPAMSGNGQMSLLSFALLLLSALVPPHDFACSLSPSFLLFSLFLDTIGTTINLKTAAKKVLQMLVDLFMKPKVSLQLQAAAKAIREVKWQPVQKQHQQSLSEDVLDALDTNDRDTILKILVNKISPFQLFFPHSASASFCCFCFLYACRCYVCLLLLSCASSSHFLAFTLHRVISKDIQRTSMLRSC